VKGFKSEYATEQENLGAVFERARIATPCFLVLEDLDSMIDDENRSFFLNELDGFESNTGLVVLATTNHPDRLDPAILNRPSRFDRKYYFNLPAVDERRAYIVAWNNAGKVDSKTGTGGDWLTGEACPHAELRLSEPAIAEVVQQTENFSFAYMKELFLSATMQWMSTRGMTLASEAALLNATDASMDEIVLEQAALLRAQMTAASSSSSSKSSASGIGRVSRAVASVGSLLRRR
jgi:SpoVK/Ycf46/Vps4 family AAA+-type ATPase